MQHINRYIGWGGLFVVAICFYVHFEIVNNRDNSTFWYTRTYTVIEKNQSEHQYKGSWKPDYYVTVKYEDEPNTLYTEYFNGAKYYNVKEGQSYTKRDIVNERKYNRANWITLGIAFVGIVMMSIAVANSMEI